MNKINISWKEFHQHTKLLAEKIKENGEYNKIVAISRGGLFPAGILAYELDIRESHTINVSSYEGSQQRDDKNVSISSYVSNIDEKTLIVDDLSDTGRTFNILRDKYPQAKYVCVYAKPQGESSADIFAVSQPDEWIVFPWD